MSAPADLGTSLNANEKVVAALAKALVDARRGLIPLIAIITCDENGLPHVSYGGEMELAPSIYFGAGMLQAKLMQQAMGPPPVLLRASGLDLKQQ